MLKDNLVTLRNLHEYSQEQIAEKINISRQAYAKWENGSTVPDILKCSMLASIYGITIDSLLNSQSNDTVDRSILEPKGKNIWGSVTVNSRGQIVIPKNARLQFDLKEGSRMIVLSDESGIALIPAEMFEENMKKLLELASNIAEIDTNS